MHKIPSHWLKLSLLCIFLQMIALSGFAGPFWHEAQATSASTTLDTTDLDVIEAVARDIQKHLGSQAPQPIAAVQMESMPGHSKNGMFGSATLMRNETTSQSVLHFRQRNHASFNLQKRVKRGDITILGEREFKQISEENGFKQKVAGLGGIIYMWLPGYDRQRSEAVFYYFEVYGDAEGCGQFVRLRRQGKVWRVVERRQEWITRDAESSVFPELRAL